MENRGMGLAAGGTAEMAAEQELQFRRLADDAPVMIWRCCLDKRCDYFNHAWLEFTGKALEDEFGRGWTRGISPGGCQRCLDTFHASFNACLPFTTDVHLLRHDGEYRWIFRNGV